MLIFLSKKNVFFWIKVHFLMKSLHENFRGNNLCTHTYLNEHIHTHTHAYIYYYILLFINVKLFLIKTKSKPKNMSRKTYKKQISEQINNFFYW